MKLKKDKIYPESIRAILTNLFLSKQKFQLLMVKRFKSKFRLSNTNLRQKTVVIQFSKRIY